jgi:hypothetical protein
MVWACGTFKSEGCQVSGQAKNTAYMDPGEPLAYWFQPPTTQGNLQAKNLPLTG